MKARTAVVAAATAALCFAAVSCGPSGDDSSGGKDTARANSPSSAKPSGDDTSPPSPPPSTLPATTGRVLTEAELTEAALATGDVADYEVTPLQGSEETGTEKAENQPCRPLAAVINGAPEPAATATVFRTVMDRSEEGKDDQTVVTEILTSHPKGAAQQVLRDVRDAVQACAGGFRTSSDEGPSTYSKVDLLDAPRVGEESIAYQVTGNIEGDKVPLVFQLVRRGSTVVTFYVADFVDATPPDLPAEVVTAQLAKLP
ncbi:hypothetical protein OG830_24540 [Streptomyces sp. NBC_00121]|uniref:hypothetical protein n=1 Tax=unclassified Streptomyces TaxID=2593676 RepID=UPI002DDC1ADB|nr:hypothetical protein [Streptomyces sp. NBC_01760]WSC71361.1 hypothetical protein OG807_24445 [Streptomyces sp. NBC_01760]